MVRVGLQVMIAEADGQLPKRFVVACVDAQAHLPWLARLARHAATLRRCETKTPFRLQIFRRRRDLCSDCVLNGHC